MNKAMWLHTLTNYNPFAGDVSAATAVLCRSLILGEDWDTALKKAQVDRLSETRDALTVQSVNKLSPSGFAPDVLAAAIHFVSSNSNFHSALEQSIKFAGPNNYCPVLVGSIGGAKWGSNNIGSELLSHCNQLERIQIVVKNYLTCYYL